MFVIQCFIYLHSLTLPENTDKLLCVCVYLEMHNVFGVCKLLNTTSTIICKFADANIATVGVHLIMNYKN